MKSTDGRTDGGTGRLEDWKRRGMEWNRIAWKNPSSRKSRTQDGERKRRRSRRRGGGELTYCFPALPFKHAFFFYFFILPGGGPGQIVACFWNPYPGKRMKPNASPRHCQSTPAASQVPTCRT